MERKFIDFKVTQVEYELIMFALSIMGEDENESSCKTLYADLKNIYEEYNG